MKTSSVIITLESVGHDEFLKVAREVRRQLEIGNRVELQLSPNVSEQSVRSLLVGRYVNHQTASKLVIKQSTT